MTDVTAESGPAPAPKLTKGRRSKLAAILVACCAAVPLLWALAGSPQAWVQVIVLVAPLALWPTAYFPAACLGLAIVQIFLLTVSRAVPWIAERWMFFGLGSTTMTDVVVLLLAAACCYAPRRESRVVFGLGLVLVAAVAASVVQGLAQLWQA